MLLPNCETGVYSACCSQHVGWTTLPRGLETIYHAAYSHSLKWVWDTGWLGTNAEILRLWTVQTDAQEPRCRKAYTERHNSPVQ